MKIIFALLIIVAASLGGYIYLVGAETTSSRPQLTTEKKEMIIDRGDIVINDMRNEDDVENAAAKVEAAFKAMNKPASQ